MKRLIFAAISLLFIHQAKAQFMMNSVAGMCPYQMQPMNAAYNVADEKDRAKQTEKTLKKRAKAIQKKISDIDKRIESLQADIDGRLQPDVSAKAIEHMQLGGNASDYHRDCQAAQAASAGSTASDVPVSNANAADANPGATAQADTNSQPVDKFCEGPLAAAWSRNIQSQGRVNPGICRETSQLVVRPGSSAYTAKCTSAINRYASLYETRRKQEKLLAEAEKDVDDFEFGDYDGDSDTEGGRCIECEKHKNAGGSSNQWMGVLNTLLQVGVPALSNYMTQQSWQKTYTAAHTYEVDNCSRLGYPIQMCSGQYSLANRYMGHIQQPYPSMMPGYFGSYNGMYGAVPGAIGTGAYGCNPGGMNSYGMPTLGNNIMGYNPYNPYNPYGNTGAPAILPYGSTSPLLGGQGPWGNAYGNAPAVLPYQAGAPGYSPYLLNSELNLLNTNYQSPYIANGSPPAVLPYPGGTTVGSATSAPVIVNPTMGTTAYTPTTLPLNTGVMYGR
jgi:hypothetical protein